MAAAAAAGGASAAGAAAALRAEALDRRARVMGSSWSLGHGHDAGGEPMQSATTAAFQDPRRLGAAPSVRAPVDHTACDKEAVFPAESRGMARQRFLTETAARFEGGATVREGFRGAVPRQGLDRLSASETTYSLGTEKNDWQTHMATTFDDPARRRAAPGPPRRARGRQDEPADYDIITGRPVDPRRTYHPRGARPNPDAAPEAQRTADREYDAIVGRVRDRHRAPAAQDLVSATLRMTGGTASSMRMEHGFVRERPPLGTAAAIRPPTPTGTDYYEAFRR